MFDHLPSASTFQLYIKVYHVFHVGHLKKILGFYNNSISIKTPITFEDLASKAHIQEKKIHSTTEHLQSKHI